MDKIANSFQTLAPLMKDQSPTVTERRKRFAKIRKLIKGKY